LALGTDGLSRPNSTAHHLITHLTHMESIKGQQQQKWSLVKYSCGDFGSDLAKKCQTYLHKPKI
jgi:hypothetical protein